jgi:hypothetical protein
MVEAVRTAEKALGRAEYGVCAAEHASQVFRRSLFVVQDIKARALHVRSRPLDPPGERPATSIHEMSDNEKAFHEAVTAIR